MILLNVAYIIWVTVENFLEKRRLKVLEARKKAYEEELELKKQAKKADLEAQERDKKANITKPTMPAIQEEDESKFSEFSKREKRDGDDLAKNEAAPLIEAKAKSDSSIDSDRIEMILKKYADE